MKSPRSQVAASAYPSSASSAFRSCRASPTTALSAWNWAKDSSSSSRARSRPNWWTMLTAMLYDGAKLDRSGYVRVDALDVRLDLVALVGRGEAQVRAHALLHGGVAAHPTEHEHDRGPQPVAVEPVDH